MKYLILIFIMFLFSNVFSQGYKLESADDCAACHQDIFKQWQGSMHAKSTLDSDPLYRAMFEWASEDTKGKITLKCKNCHMPYYNLNDSLIDNNVIRERPVDCLYCHSVEEIHKAPVFSDIKYSAADNATSDYHIIDKRDHFENEKLCMICHAELINPNQVSICTTGDEYYNQNTIKESCQSCHMPSHTGLKSSLSDTVSEINAHTFSGPHNADFLKDAIKISGQMDKNVLTISVDNSEIPHSFPTGTPLRMVILKVVGLNKDGKIIYQNWKKNPLKEDGKAVFARMFSDENGQMPSPPWRAVKVGRETRLKPGEIRKISYHVPGNVTKIQGKLFFQLAPPPILKKLKIDDPYLKTSHLINQFELEIK